MELRRSCTNPSIYTTRNFSVILYCGVEIYWGLSYCESFHRRHFQVIFFVSKSFYFDSAFSLICPNGSINNMPPLREKMFWCRIGDKPIPEPMLTKNDVTRPQSVGGKTYHTTVHGNSILKNIGVSPPSATYMRQWIWPALVQIRACRLFGAKPLSQPMLGYCQLDLEEQTSVKFWSKYGTFHTRKCIWNSSAK